MREAFKKGKTNTNINKRLSFIYPITENQEENNNSMNDSNLERVIKILLKIQEMEKKQQYQ